MIARHASCHDRRGRRGALPRQKRGPQPGQGIFDQFERIICNPKPFKATPGSSALSAIPVAHSLSPRIHNHAFKVLGLSYAYVPLMVPERNLHTAMAALRALSFSGANVTIPFKRQVLPLLRRSFAVINHYGRGQHPVFSRMAFYMGPQPTLKGFTGPCHGWAMIRRTGRIVILGNGGIARTLAFALALNRRRPKPYAYRQGRRSGFRPLRGTYRIQTNLAVGT